MQEAGIAGVDMNLWWVTAAPAGTLQPIIDKLNGWFTEIGKMDETREFSPKRGGAVHCFPGRNHKAHQQGNRGLGTT